MKYSRGHTLCKMTFKKCYLESGFNNFHRKPSELYKPIRLGTVSFTVNMADRQVGPALIKSVYSLDSFY